jgi:ankyrin repeat protein
MTMMIRFSLAFAFGLALVGCAARPAPAPRRPAYGADDLGHAAALGRIAQVRAILAAGVGANAKGNTRKSPLRMATSIGCTTDKRQTIEGGGPAHRLEVVDALIEAGADVNDVDASGLGILMMATQSCPAPVIERLVRAGADLEQRSPQGFTPLSMALITKNVDAAELLIERGARIGPDAAKKLFPEPPADPRLAKALKAATAKAPARSGR